MNFGTKQVANIFVGTLNAIEAYFGAEKVWGKSEPVTGDWLCFTAEEANSTVSMGARGSAPSVSLEYSTDGNNWIPFVVGTTTVTLSNIGDKMYMRATSAGNTGMGSSTSNYNQFYLEGKIAASGNLNTLLDQNGNATLTSYCYYSLFYGCIQLTTAPALPATTLASSCYASMFSGCTYLTQAPELPATTLAGSCYSSMFSGCTHLTSAPELPATTLADKCYFSMFSGCKSLTIAPELPTTTLFKYCYYNMFSGCSSLTGTITIPIMNTNTSIPSFAFYTMFNNCSNLTKVILDSSTFASIPMLGNSISISVFNNTTDERFEIHVPSSLEADWKTASNWSDWASHIVGV